MTGAVGPTPRQSRYARVAGQSAAGIDPGRPRYRSRRWFLTALTGAVTTLVAGCARSDEEVFADLAPSSVPDQGTRAEAGGSSPVTAGDGSGGQVTLRVQEPGQAGGDASAGSQATTTTTAATGDTIAAPPSGSPAPSTSSGAVDGGAEAVSAGRDLVIAFTYQQLPGGKNVPPYIAVWVEDADGSLVKTVALWYQQSGRGERWLPDLRRWFGLDQQRLAEGGGDVVAAVSGPTRQPGSHQVAWGGAREDGGRAAAGSYHICIESARERGPYSLVRQQVQLAGSTLDVALPSDNELVDCSARLA